MKIPDEDLEVTALVPEDWKQGGQHVGTMIHIIQVKHKPTGLLAACGSERSQHRNRQTALEMVEWGLTALGYNYERTKQ